MPTDSKPTSAGNPQRRRRTGTVIPAAVILFMTLACVAFYLLARVDPGDPAASALPLGDRVERRLDAFLDNSRPGWADPLEAWLKKSLSKSGWH